MRFTRIDWANVMFSDESRFHLDSSDGRARVYRHPGERYSDACVVQRTRFGGGSVMCGEESLVMTEPRCM